MMQLRKNGLPNSVGAMNLLARIADQQTYREGLPTRLCLIGAESVNAVSDSVCA